MEDLLKSYGCEDDEGIDAEDGTQAAVKAQCELCKKEAAKYKCPRCALRTCSLACVKDHKTKFHCSGKRDRTAFVPIGSFNDNIIHSG
jgi:hypothetical protein